LGENLKQMGITSPEIGAKLKGATNDLLLTPGKKRREGRSSGNY